MAVSRRPIAIDLFAGAGGLSLGVEQAGFDVVAAVEYDPVHAAIHRLNFPQTAVLCRSVADVTGAELRQAAGIGRQTVDALIGGPPCQGFSLIGHRVFDDPRNGLVLHFVRLVDELRPRTFIFENVPGMASGRHRELLDELIERFEKIGYRVRRPYQILNAANYGVPQDRRRLVLLGSRKDTPLPNYPAGLTSAPAARLGQLGLLDLPQGPTVRDALRDLPDIDRFEQLFETDVLNYALNGASDYALRLRGAIEDREDFSYPRQNDSTRLTGCARANHSATSRRRFERTTPGETEPISRFRRLPPGGLCNTLRAGTASDRGGFTSPRPIHPFFARCISVREAARLHSYPDWFRFHRTIWHGFRQIGNSVPPLLGRAIAAELMKALEVRAVRPRKRLELGPEELATLNMRQAADYFGVDRGVIPQRTRVGRGA